MIEQSPRERVFNVPAVVLALMAVFALVYALFALVLSNEQVTWFLVLFAFIPARYDMAALANLDWPGGIAADIWTFVTYSLIHGNFNHLFFNAIWFLAFGTPVARRFGAWRFLAFFAVTAAAGAAVHLATHIGEPLPMVGASAAISGAMAAAMRFAFQPGGPLGLFGRDEASYRVPAVPLATALRDRRVLIFLLVWFGLNALFGMNLFAMPGVGVEQGVAWQAHIGGFLAGLLAFAAFDPVRSPTRSHAGEEPTEH